MSQGSPHPRAPGGKSGCVWGARVRTGGPVWPAPVRLIISVYAVVVCLPTDESNFEPAGRRFNSCRAHHMRYAIIILMKRAFSSSNNLLTAFLLPSLGNS